MSWMNQAQHTLAQIYILIVRMDHGLKLEEKHWKNVLKRWMWMSENNWNSVYESRKKRKKETNKEQADPRALERFHKKAYSTSTDVLGYLQKVKRRKKK